MYASLWNFRAFIERDFHRIDHLEAAMGVLVHPSFQDELVNGVAVTFDPLHGMEESIYVNSQSGEDLVTNPAALSGPEKILIGQSGYTVLSFSNQVPAGQLLMGNDHLNELRERLTVIHHHFAGLYIPPADEPFAMEIEFKITSDNVLAIKQARPWVFSDSAATPQPPTPDPDPTPAPSPTPDPSPTPAPPTPPLPVPQKSTDGGGGGGGGGFGPAPVAPSFGDGFRTTRAVAEDARPGDAVGDPVSATHPDELEITYSLSGTDAASFTVDEETGQISMKEGMDLTLGMTYTVNLTATDSAGFGAIIIVMIEVTEASFSPYDRNGNDRIERDEVLMPCRTTSRASSRRTKS